MIHDNNDCFDIAMMCELLEVSRQGYYDWIDRPLCALAIKREQIVDAIRLAHVESHCRYGSPNIHQDLINQGISCCVNTVAKRMPVCVAAVSNPTEKLQDQLQHEPRGKLLG